MMVPWYFKNMALFTTFFFTRVCTKPRIVLPDKCRWRAGPIAWPPHSSNITPTDFSLWGFENSSIARFLVAGLSNLNGRLWQKLWTLKKSRTFIKFHFICLFHLKFFESRIFFYLKCSFFSPFCRTLDYAARGTRATHPSIPTLVFVEYVVYWSFPLTRTALREVQRRYMRARRRGE